jgi:putative nucleotidyltransferase with HDIG domain
MTDHASDATARVAVHEELLRRFASGSRAAQLYAADHPLLGRNVEGLLASLKALHQPHATVTIGIVDHEFVVADTPLAKASLGMKDLIDKLLANNVERISFERGVTAEEIVDLMLGVAKLSSKGADAAPAWRFPRIRIGQITKEEEGRDGIASDMAAIRQLYTNAVSAAEAAWEAAAVEGKPDVPAALNAVEGLADAVTQNRTALVALTAMRNYDNYTFTHMVNVSILTMGQARALGIEGRLLREFGLSALMHDIGKVRTPKEILQKPERLTDEEFVIMRRHPVEGAEILRRTPEMPILAPVVAFEHHLRIDGTGYPEGAKRSALNLGTMICSIADVYDAMRSQRAYQQAFPTERVLAVLKKDDGAQFDAHLVRRFVQLLGIYPPGTLVKLQSQAIAVVTRVHAPDPYRPRVKLLVAPEGTPYDVPIDRNLWERSPDGSPADSVVGPVEPALYGIDPLNYIEVARA